MAIAVPVVNNNTIRTERAPDQRQDASAATPDAFGAGIGRALQQTGNVLGNAGDQLAQEAARQKEVDQGAQILDASNKLQDGLRDFNAQEAAKQGVNINGATQRTNDFIKTQVEQLGGQFSDPKAKLAFNRVASAARESTLDAASRRETQAKTAATIEITKTTLDTTKQAAIDTANDDKVAEDQMKIGLAALALNPTGQPKEVLDAAMKSYRSDVQTARIQRIGVDNPTAAKAMYERVKDQITGGDHVKIEKVLEPLVGRQTGASNAADVIGRPGPQVEQLATVAATTMHQMPPPAMPGGTATPDAPARPVSSNVKGVNLPRLAVAVAGPESGGDPNAVSPRGAAGLLQVMPGTARDISKRLGDGLITPDMSDAQIKETLKDPATGVRYGATYLHDQLVRYNGDIPAALVAYNAGPAVADAWLKSRKGPGDLSGLPAETQAYVPKVMSRYGDVLGGGPADYGGQANALNRIRMGAEPPPGAKMTADNWSLKFYKPADMLAPTEGGKSVDARSAMMADTLGKAFFDKTGIRVAINDVNDSPGTAGKRRGSADPNDNPHVGNSQHLHGKAFDFQIQNLTPDQKKLFLQTARDIGFSGVGFYEGKSGHLHLDTGNARSWGGLPSWAGAGIPTLGQSSMAVGASLDGLPLPPSMQAGAGGANTPSGRRALLDAPSNQSAARSFLPAPLSPDARDLIGSPTPGIGAVPATGAGAVGTSPVSSAAPVGMPPALRSAIDLTADFDPAAIRDAIANDPRNDTAVKMAAAKNYAERAIRAQEDGQKRALKTLRAASIQHIQKGGSADDLDPDLYAALLEKDPKFVTDTLPGMEERIAKRKDKTDPAAYHDLALMDADTFQDLDLTAWRGKLSQADYEKFSDRQATARKSNATDAMKWDGIQSQNAIATNALKAAGIFPDKDDAEANTRSGLLMSRLEDARAAFQATNKREWSVKEMKETVDQLMTPVNPGDYTGKMQYLFEQGTKDQNAFRKRNELPVIGYQGNLAPVQKLEQVPPVAMQTLLDNHVALRGGPPTPAQTTRYYNDFVSLSTGREPVPDGPMRNEIISKLRKAYGASIQTDRSRAAELEAEVSGTYSDMLRMLFKPKPQGFTPPPLSPNIPY
jgi:hypothetical protein